MGYAKYFEDINDAIDDIHYISFGAQRTVETTNYHIIYICPYCNMVFEDRELLFDHIRREHNAISSLVLINRQVATSNAYIKDVKSALIRCYDKELLVNINGSIYNINKDTREFDITQLLRKIAQEKKQCKIIVNKKEWCINFLSDKSFDVKKINNKIGEWNVLISTGQQIKSEYGEVNEFEKRCLEGFYDYFIACSTEGKNRTKRYEDAYAILKDFVGLSKSAGLVLKIIAFQFNWVEELKSLCAEQDIFYEICKIYDRTSSESKILDFAGDNNLFVEDEVEKSIRAVIACQNHNDEYLGSYLSEFSDKDVHLLDKNLKDRLCLIWARKAKYEGDSKKAKRYYSEIDTPYFWTERDEYLNGGR